MPHGKTILIASCHIPIMLTALSIYLLDEWKIMHWADRAHLSPASMHVVCAWALHGHPVSNGYYLTEAKQAMSNVVVRLILD